LILLNHWSGLPWDTSSGRQNWTGHYARSSRRVLQSQRSGLRVRCVLAGQRIYR